jgi:hypothetical protein
VPAWCISLVLSLSLSLSLPSLSLSLSLSIFFDRLSSLSCVLLSIDSVERLETVKRFAHGLIRPFAVVTDLGLTCGVWLHRKTKLQSFRAMASCPAT